ncbi:putative oxidoreductase [Vibrio halioticoli NBRC 102217]|uniref:Putative oxidoreductase n=1 Tax=Vibrio halioticoli NBRC 102217 TaxID=1219072 RepID=V5FE60_9VIBR|nr:Gfo/Idh/MocA family oxidoreductase [Vibrio halioticoli]GAD88131.1 putative oxidoreductase [Vibrio halioticoli NBRC 102217]
MLKLGVIGSNWITERFIKATQESHSFWVHAIYSRELEKAREFAAKYDAPYYFDSLEDLANSDVDAVYIASPNSLHAPQAIQMMEQGKHVIVEKPMASNYRLAKQMYAVAERNKVVLFEAYMSAYLPNFTIVRQKMAQLGTLRKVFMQYCQYSSRYQKFLDGDNPNTFNPNFSNGSIMDIGFYCIAACIDLFGEPQSIQASATLLTSGVDGHGSVILNYEGFDAVIMHSKVNDSYLPSEIQGEDAALQIDMIALCQKVELYQGGQLPISIGVQQNDNPMYYEAQAFAQAIQAGGISPEAKQRALSTAKIITQIRLQTGVVFPDDNE